MLCDAVGEGLAPPESDLGFLNAFQKVLILPSGRSKPLPYGGAFRICHCEVDDIAPQGEGFGLVHPKKWVRFFGEKIWKVTLFDCRMSIFKI